MRDYLNANERNQFMSIMATMQSIQGVRTIDGSAPKIQTMREDWSGRNNLSKEEHKNLKMAETYLKKFIEGVYGRLNPKEQQQIAKKIMKFDYRLIDDFTLKQIYRDIQDRMTNAVVPREQFHDWCEQIMDIHCNGCKKDWSTCSLYQVFDENFIPESSFNCSNCRYAYCK